MRADFYSRNQVVRKEKVPCFRYEKLMAGKFVRRFDDVVASLRFLIYRLLEGAKVWIKVSNLEP